MPKSLFFYLLLTLLSCQTAEKSRAPLVQYKDWKTFIARVFEKELDIVCQKWPREWKKCPDGKNDWACINIIDIQEDIQQLELLKKTYKLPAGKPCKFAVIHDFSYGFNMSYCEMFLIRINGAWRGKNRCKSGPYEDLSELLKESPEETDATLSKKDLAAYNNLKSGTFVYNGDTKIVTILNEKYEILENHMALYP